MSYLRTLTLAAGALGVSGLACTKDSVPAPRTSLSAVVAPLELPAATDACYHLTVWNDVTALDDDTEVWDQPSLCASQYGADDGIRFTGICDAQAGLDDDDVSNDGKNAIRLVLNDVYTGGTVDTGSAMTVGEDYINPCPAPTEGEDNGCVLIADCAPNEDTKIEFNLTVMRQASLGFFDTVVRFQDVFCAAKLDCVDNDGETTLDYLYDPATESDGPTAVLGFACVGGGGEDVHMYLDDVTITCDNGSATIDVAGGSGNLSASELVQSAPNPLFGAAINTGAGFEGAHYWNVLVGMNLDPANGECTLTTSGTVSELAFTDNATPTHNRYPFITWSVPLSDDGVRQCTRHPLNGGNGVATAYTDIDAPETFDHTLALAVAAPACPCWDTADLTALAQSLMSGAYEPWAGEQTWSGGSQLAFMIDGGDDEFYVVAQADEGTYECQYYAVVSGASVSVQQEIGEADHAACTSAIRVLMNDPCQTDNGGCSGPTPYCTYDGPNQSHCQECVTDDDCQDPAAPSCHPSTNTCEDPDPCAVDNGGCAGACWNDGAFSSQCVACTGDVHCASGTTCDMTGPSSATWHTCVDCTADVHCDAGTTCDTTHSGSATWHMCTECGPRSDYQANYYCASGTWCTLANTCEATPSLPIVEVNPNPRTWDGWQSGCAALGSYHRPTYAELAGAMQAFFQNGEDMGYTFIPNNGFLTSRYLHVAYASVGYMPPPGNWNGAQHVFGDGFSLNSRMLCFPD